jgi:hypothetical protein
MFQPATDFIRVVQLPADHPYFEMFRVDFTLRNGLWRAGWTNYDLTDGFSYSAADRGLKEALDYYRGIAANVFPDALDTTMEELDTYWQQKLDERNRANADA